ncbi:MAG: oxygen-independent coproporphyrinogen III oxidase [Oligoflexales bacterium]|nr:oxygen-independent coproporphyrinogen III oxidase [Oligoflexales bacterium]
MADIPSFCLHESERLVYKAYARLALPRHTSYPTAPVWESDFSGALHEKHLLRLSEQKRPWSLYIHIPFCRQLCYYCGCNKEIVSDERRREKDPLHDFLPLLHAELRAKACILRDNPVIQIHFGGGTPTFLSSASLRDLMGLIRSLFSIAPDAEVAMEIDPRVTSDEQLDTLWELGFNRLSLGVQDFDEKVQRAVNRLQPFELVAQKLSYARSVGFCFINFDLIYGLPFQSVQGMAVTLEKVLTLAPERIAYYRMAMIPDLLKWQRAFRKEDLPGEDSTLEMMLLAAEVFQKAGYAFIGLDHFAKKTDPLNLAYESGTLRRNFQGMTTQSGLDIVGFGPSSVSQFEGAYVQNLVDRRAWERSMSEFLNSGADLLSLPLEKGVELNQEDRRRQRLIERLYGYGQIDTQLWLEETGLDFDLHFAKEKIYLEKLIDEGILEPASEGTYHLSPVLGRLLVRVVAAVFDAYVDKGSLWPEFQNSAEPDLLLGKTKKRRLFSQVG